MTELFIDNQAVTLPLDLDLSIRMDNPILTKNGTFTLDLTLSLKEPNNAILYQNIDRLQSNARIRNRHAVLIVNGHVILDGTEAVISNTNDEVKIQLLSGNSELNYFLGSDQFISSLDLGSEEMDNTLFNDAISKQWPAVNYCPAQVKIGGEIVNQHPIKSRTQPYQFTNLAIQPYLIAMIEKVIKALGYTIDYNELKTDDFIKRIFLLNRDKTGAYNKVLPGWTIKDFLEEVEKIFNVVFLIERNTRHVQIRFNRSISGSGVYTISNVLDNFEREEAEEEKRISYTNVAYNFPSSNEFKFMDIDDSLFHEFTTKICADYSNMINDMTFEGQFLDDVTYEHLTKEDKTMFYVGDTETFYIADQANFVQGKDLKVIRYPRKVNTFNREIKSDDNEFLKLDFFPCCYFSKDEKIAARLTVTRIPYLPASDNESESGTTTIQEVITGGTHEDKESKEPVALCCFYGDAASGTYDTATDYVDENISNTEIVHSGRGTFRLSGTNGLAAKYYHQQQINTEREYTISFLMRDLPDIQAKFLLNNKLFLCKELEYKINAEGINPVIQGRFFEVL